MSHDNQQPGHYAGHRAFDPNYIVNAHNKRAPYIIRMTDFEMFPGDAENLLVDTSFRFIDVDEWDILRTKGHVALQTHLTARFGPRTIKVTAKVTAERPPEDDGPPLEIVTAQPIATQSRPPEDVDTSSKGKIEAVLGKITADRPGAVQFADGRPDGTVGGETPAMTEGYSLDDLLESVHHMNDVELNACIVERGIIVKANASEAQRKAAIQRDISKQATLAHEAQEAAAADMQARR